MAILAIETATSLCSVALQHDDVITERNESDQLIHSDVLLPWIRALLDSQSLGFSDISKIVVGSGPGGFTSLRIGLAVSQGLALAHGVALFPVSTLLNTAAGCDEDERVMVVMDARLGQVYTQAFERGANGVWRAVNEASVVKPEEVVIPTEGQEWAVAGQGLSLYQEILEPKLLKHATNWRPEMMPSAQRALTLACESVEPWSLVAEYVRDEVTH